MKRLLLVLCVVALLISCRASTVPPIDVSLELMHLQGASVLRQADFKIWQVSEKAGTGILFEVFHLRVGSREYVCDDLLNVYDPTGKKVIVLSEQAKTMLFEMWNALKATACAEPLKWLEAQKLLERMDSAEVLDVETGKRFMVQRRGGTYHADVQPLTRADTAIMKEIYGGVWSWDRRAVIVTADGRTVAASMNGMPHGQGALNNNFPGHFCIHFWESITHASRTKDLGHHLMISKAAGEVWGLVRAATPEEQVKNMAAALNQKDLWLTQLFLLPISTSDLEHLVANVETIEIDEAVLAGPACDPCAVQIAGEVVYRGGSRVKLRTTVELRLVEGVWKVDPTILANIIG